MDTKGLPRFDPAKHPDDDLDTIVLVEMFSTTGDLFRRADPVAVIRPDAEEWVRLVLDAGGEPASPAYAINVRSGTPPEKGTEGAANPDDTKVRAWPFDPADPPEDLDDDTDTAVVEPADQAKEG